MKNATVSIHDITWTDGADKHGTSFCVFHCRQCCHFCQVLSILLVSSAMLCLISADRFPSIGRFSNIAYTDQRLNILSMYETSLCKEFNASPGKSHSARLTTAATTITATTPAKTIKEQGAPGDTLTRTNIRTSTYPSAANLRRHLAERAK